MKIELISYSQPAEYFAKKCAEVIATVFPMAKEFVVK